MRPFPAGCPPVERSAPAGVFPFLMGLCQTPRAMAVLVQGMAATDRMRPGASANQFHAAQQRSAVASEDLA